MITVGSVYMSIPDAPIKEIMKDIMEMSRGVQHPTRGLFLRHYLSGATRDYLPIGSGTGPTGNLQDSIGFVLTNFIEMNKLWVRLQHQGHSREREKREAERRELRILVGTNLVRLSQLEGVELDMYKRIILPSILEQVVNCKDVIAQDYLMEVVIQVFSDDFHLRTLGLFLSACAQLHPKVNIKGIVIALIDRLASYAAREAENDSPEEIRRQEEEAGRRLKEKMGRMRNQAGQVWDEVQQEEARRKASEAQEEEARAAGTSATSFSNGERPDASMPGMPSVATHSSAEPEQAANRAAAPGQDTSFTAVPEGLEDGAWGGGNQEDTEANKGRGMRTNAFPSAAPQGTAEDNPHTDEQKQKEASNAEAKQQAPAPTAPPVVKKFRGIPEDVRLFEVFWEQIVRLIRARPDLSLQDVTALLVSLANLSLSCYPDRLEYVDQVLGFTSSIVQEQEAQIAAHGQPQGGPGGGPGMHSQSASSAALELHSPATSANLTSLLLAPINSYTSALTLLALPSYSLLLATQVYQTRKIVAQAVVSSVLKNETLLSTPEDVDGILDLCSTLVKDQRDAVSSTAYLHGGGGGGTYYDGRGGRGLRPGQMPTPSRHDLEEIAEEQGWLARMIHLFRAGEDEDVAAAHDQQQKKAAASKPKDSPLEIQFSLLQVARRHFIDGGPMRIRHTLPPLVTSALNLARKYKMRQPVEAQWEFKVTTLYKYVHQVICVLYNKVESSEICLRLFLMAAASADEAGFEELSYDFYVQAFTIYEESISESKSQLNAIGMIIASLHRAQVFGLDNYDRLITKAALHGAKLLKKPHQAAAVLMASHLWWQQPQPRSSRMNNGTSVSSQPRQGTINGAAAMDHSPSTFESKPQASPLVLRDGKRVLECLQKTVRIANSCIEEHSTVDILCSAFDQYIFFFGQGVEEIQPKHLNTIIDSIGNHLSEIGKKGGQVHSGGSAPASHTTSNLLFETHPSGSNPGGGGGGRGGPAAMVEASRRQFGNQLLLIKRRKEAALLQSAIDDANIGDGGDGSDEKSKAASAAKSGEQAKAEKKRRKEPDWGAISIAEKMAMLNGNSEAA